MHIKRTVGAGRWTSTLATVVAFGALCATLAYWTMQLLAPPVAIAPTGSLVDYRTVPELDSAAALFGARGGVSTQAAQADVRVLGVAASPTRASAVLVVGSGPARAYMVGDAVGDDMRLIEVRSDVAVLERNHSRIELQAPKRPSIAMLWSGPAAPSESREPLAAPAALAPDTRPMSPRSGPPMPEGDRLSGLRAGGVPADASGPVASPGDGAPAPRDGSAQMARDGSAQAPQDGSVQAARDGMGEPRPDPAAGERLEAQASGAPSPGGVDPR